MVSIPRLAGLYGLACLGVVSAFSKIEDSSSPYCPVIYDKPPTNCRDIPETFLAFSDEGNRHPVADTDVLENAADALVVLQNHYFEADIGTWPSAIDWTAAAVETVIAGTLTTLSKAFVSVDLAGLADWKAKENMISSFYAQIVNSYFGQDILSIRAQAYDDILWVVLGWLEAIKFVETHAKLHYSDRKFTQDDTSENRLKKVLNSMPWHGHNWLNSFSHRARIFWNFASRGWDMTLCNGGMLWNPRLRPYKNSITNELWISASISMYRYFPGDNFTSPWLKQSSTFPEKDPRHLASAIEGYRWLVNVGMLNHQGLFVDGYHVDASKPGNAKCDQRDEMVYTYNQGVLLTGQRELWSVTGSASYLQDGHRLIQNLIAATGWDLEENKSTDDVRDTPRGWLPPWRGLGRGGILEEACDPSGLCSQDGQAFKGIFFHHFATFCAPLDNLDAQEGKVINMRGYDRAKKAHSRACRSYISWLSHNVKAAIETRDDQGRFGMWWGAGIFDALVTPENDGINHKADNTTDYRNSGTPKDVTWGEDGRWVPGTGRSGRMEDKMGSLSDSDQVVMRHVERRGSSGHDGLEDPNDRGLGRTVETQMGGLALLRAYWDISQEA